MGLFSRIVTTMTVTTITTATTTTAMAMLCLVHGGGNDNTLPDSCKGGNSVVTNGTGTNNLYSNNSITDRGRTDSIYHSNDNRDYERRGNR